jgi:hypothetical protein
MTLFAAEGGRAMLVELSILRSAVGIPGCLAAKTRWCCQGVVAARGREAYVVSTGRAGSAAVAARRPAGQGPRAGIPRPPGLRGRPPGTEITYRGAYWRAVIREGNGETTVVRYDLRQLLDRLDELESGPVSDEPQAGAAEQQP